MNGLWRSWTHPTNLPMMIGMLWFVVFFAMMGLIPIRVDRYIGNESVRVRLLLLPALFLFGLSGLLMILRREASINLGIDITAFGCISMGFLA